MSTSIKSITSRDNALLVRLRKLVADPSAYRKLEQIWIEGEHLCASYARRGHSALQAVITDEGWGTPALKGLAETAQSVVVIPAALMPSLSTLESAPPLCFVVPWTGPGELLTNHASVILDRLQDAGNVGNILRSAAAFGYTQIVALKGTAALWAPKVLRAGMGAHFGLHLVEACEEAALSQLQVPMLATSSHAEHSLHKAHLPFPCAWVLGHEGQGISSGVMQLCSQTLRIPQPGGEESLNVASAAAICLYETARAR